MTKEDVLDELWEKDIAGGDTLTAVVDAVWSVLNLPPKGNLIRLNGNMDSKLTIGEGEAKCTVLVLSSDENVVKLNYLKDSPVVVFGIQVEKEEVTPATEPSEIEQLAAEAEEEEADDEPEVAEEEEEQPEEQPKRGRAKK